MKHFYAPYNEIVDITPLTNLTNLTFLGLSNNSINEISSLANLVKLEDLYLSNNNISNLSPLVNLTELSLLDLSNNNINDISLLSNFGNLTELFLTNNNISDISSLENLKNLTWLSLADNNIVDITPLTNLTNLNFLSVSNNCIRDTSILNVLVNCEIQSWGNPGFEWNVGEEYFSSMWVGDILELKTNAYVYEVLEGKESVELHSEALNDRRYENGYIIFLKEGKTTIQVSEKVSGKILGTYEFTILPAKESYVEQLVPEKIKIGFQIDSRLYIYHNCLFGQFTEDGIKNNYGVSTLTWDMFDKYFYVGTHREGGFEVREDIRTLNGFFNGCATKPGEFLIASAKDEENPYIVTIEEPVIHTNLSEEILVGTELEVTTLLENTDLENIKVDKVSEKSYPIGYQPRIEIVSGEEYIERGNGDYTNILSSTETIKFLKEGTVIFRVVYDMLPIMQSPVAYLTEEAMYSPEAIFTVNIVKEFKNQEVVLDYTNSNLPTSEELLEEIKNISENGKLTLQVSDSITLESDVLKELKNGNHEVVVNKIDMEENLVYSWNIPNIDNTSNDWNTNIIFGNENTNVIDVLENYAVNGNVETIRYEHEGILPGEASVKLYVADNFKVGDIIYYYYYNESENILEEIGSYTVDENGYVTIQMEHCSDYVLTEEMLTEKEESSQKPNDEESKDEKPDDAPNQEESKDEKPTTPQTGDSNWIFTWSITGLCALILTGFSFKKYRK